MTKKKKFTYACRAYMKIFLILDNDSTNMLLGINKLENPNKIKIQTFLII